MAVGLLPGVRVVDLGQRISAPYCAKILAQMGAEVIKVEPPEGDAARRMGPFPDDIPHPEKSGLFLAARLPFGQEDIRPSSCPDWPPLQRR